MPALALTVDQSLVDAYLERVDRFVNNVRTFGESLTSMLSHSRNEEPVIETSTYQEMAAVQPVQEIVTAEDIDLDELLKGLDLDSGDLVI